MVIITQSLINKKKHSIGLFLFLISYAQFKYNKKTAIAVILTNYRNIYYAIFFTDAFLDLVSNNVAIFKMKYNPNIPI